MNVAWRVLLGVVSLLGPGQAAAQPSPGTGPPVDTFSEMASRVSVDAGATVVLTDSSGQQVKGKLTALSSDALSLLSNGRTLTFRGQELRGAKGATGATGA